MASFIFHMKNFLVRSELLLADAIEVSFSWTLWPWYDQVKAIPDACVYFFLCKSFPEDEAADEKGCVLYVVVVDILADEVSQDIMKVIVVGDSA